MKLTKSLQQQLQELFPDKMTLAKLSVWWYNDGMPANLRLHDIGADGESTVHSIVPPNGPVIPVKLLKLEE